MNPNRTILIVEDNEVIRKVLARALAMPGVETMQAPDGMRGLLEAIACKPDVIVLDLRMPGIDGREVCRALRRDPEVQDTPILVLSGLQSFQDAMSALSAGANDYMTKPFNINELKARVEGLLLARASRKG